MPWTVPEVANVTIPGIVEDEIGLYVCNKFGDPTSNPCQVIRYLFQCLYKDLPEDLVPNLFGYFITVH